MILAGDIGVGLEGLRWAETRFPARSVIYVPGNHEFYHHDIALIDELKAQAPDHIHVLNDDQVIIDGVRFLGSILWTNFALFGEAEKFFAMQKARQQMTDFSIIQNNGRATLWIHGHMHDPFDYEIYGSRVVCNPRGYAPRALASDFRPDLVVDI